ncbi:MAG: hypothetical protein Hyperionvirus21_7 [Hyperionvirus sp.]|uniref:Uncharacterized protein n=1 Tax=Hyperionvirus sp. TaxID=2487770 RepID=A0A3G5AEH2_9VIRU|nr:MAG: hypothetical protein Hyperionvirus21_7 [Hyperionvirus sp.]
MEGNDRGRPKKYANDEERRAAKLADKKRWYAKYGGTNVVEYNKKYYEAHKDKEKEVPGEIFSATSYQPFEMKVAEKPLPIPQKAGYSFSNIGFFYAKYA